jgi:hypothetical protein
MDTVWSPDTAAAVAVNVAEAEPEVTVTADGTATAALLLATETTIPAAGAVLVSETVHVVVPVPSTVDGVQLRDASCAAARTVNEVD